MENTVRLNETFDINAGGALIVTFSQNSFGAIACSPLISFILCTTNVSSKKSRPNKELNHEKSKARIASYRSLS